MKNFVNLATLVWMQGVARDAKLLGHAVKL